jgi:3-oxoacyl-[acyl-carrier-protein] synthase II
MDLKNMVELHRVVVVGMGAISPLGNTLPETWDQVLKGTSARSRITAFDPAGYRCEFAAQVGDFDCGLKPKELERIDRFIQLSLVAGDQAMAQAGLDRMDESIAHRCGVYWGSGIGGINLTYAEALKYGFAKEDSPHPSMRTSPTFIPGLITNQASGMLSMRYNLQGPSVSCSTACATGAHSIGEAAMAIQLGKMDMALVGGGEAAIMPLGVGGFSAMRALSLEGKSCPFDQSRDGFILAEGAAGLVLCSLGFALDHQLEILAELTGYGAGSDAFSMFAPEPSGRGASHAMRAALADAGLSPWDIGYINAHATSTPTGDMIEVGAIRAVFGNNAENVFVSSTKGATGHLIGAAGSIEACFAIQAIITGTLPHTANLVNLDPECSGVRHIMESPIAQLVDHAASNSFGFGGTNTCLILSRWKE